MNDRDRAFAFIPLNRSPDKPRKRGVTEIRGPYYSALGRHQLEDVLETMGVWIDTLKFAGGSFALMPRKAVRELIDLCHRHRVAVSTGGFVEHVLTLGPEAVDRYLGECRDLGFDIVEVSAGFLVIADDDIVRLTEKVRAAGLEPKPEVGIQFGAGGASAVAELQAEGTKDVAWATALMKRHLEAGATMIMVESEGITECVAAWRTDVVARMVAAVGLSRLMFEAADPAVFDWYVKTYGPHVNLFVDHSQIVQLECLRSGLWGTKNLWGRVVTYPRPPGT
jgi:phosphosulfolactate synthase (CoM biosynthesis protein A)